MYFKGIDSKVFIEFNCHYSLSSASVNASAGLLNHETDLYHDERFEKQNDASQSSAMKSISNFREMSLFSQADLGKYKRKKKNILDDIPFMNQNPLGIVYANGRPLGVLQVGNIHCT